MQDPATDHFSYGGQAVIEGVMMRGRREMAVAVRAPSGEIVVWSEEVRHSRLARRVCNKPFIRGAILLWDTMTLGVRSLMFSSTVGRLTGIDTAAHAPPPTGAKPRPQPKESTGPALWLMVSISIMFAIGLFFVLPLVVIAFLDRYIASAFVSNVIEGLIRLGLLVGYIKAISNLPEIRRVFAYHGAEHKTIHAWEAGDPLDVAHVRRHPLAHPRCGTAFLVVVMLLSIAVFMTLGRPDLLPRIASRIVLVPVVAAFAYEFLKLGARHIDHPLMRLLLSPGIVFQRLTTREPDDSMLQVAIAAFLRVLAADGRISESDPRLSGARLVDVNGRPFDVPLPLNQAPVPTAAD